MLVYVDDIFIFGEPNDLMDVMRFVAKRIIFTDLGTCDKF